MLTKAKEIFSRLSFIKLSIVALGLLVFSAILFPLTASATSTDVWNAIIQCESGGNPRAQNPHSSASGLFQDLDSTWHHFGGYARAMDAPVSVQWEFNTRLPISNWDASRSCWSHKIGSAPTVYSQQFSMSKTVPAVPKVYRKPVIKFHPAQADPVVSTTVQLTSSGSYTVIRGDTLSGIASAHNETGGWSELYSKNVSVVGGNPNLIFPGQNLNL